MLFFVVLFACALAQQAPNNGFTAYNPSIFPGNSNGAFAVPTQQTTFDASPQYSQLQFSGTQAQNTFSSLPQITRLFSIQQVAEPTPATPPASGSTTSQQIHPPPTTTLIVRDTSEPNVLTVDGVSIQDVETDMTEIRATIESRYQINDTRLIDLNAPGNDQRRSEIITSVMNDASARTNAVVSYLKPGGRMSSVISKLQTTQVRLEPIYRWDSGNQYLIGYVASSSLSFRVINPQAATVLSQIVSLGVTRIDSVSFVPSDEKQNAARQAAIAAACQDALTQGLTALRSVKITAEPQVHRIELSRVSAPASESFSSIDMAAGAPAAMAAIVRAPMPIMPGTSTIRATCTMKLKW